jgi:copper chaperone
MAKLVLDVPDISCEHCEKTILNALEPQAGVKAVQVSIPAKTVTLDLDEGTLPVAQVREILDEEGYPVAGVHTGA